jgi:hypothetical protein
MMALTMKHRAQSSHTILITTVSTIFSFSCPYACVCHGVRRDVGNRQSLFV